MADSGAPRIALGSQCLDSQNIQFGVRALSHCGNCGCSAGRGLMRSCLPPLLGYDSRLREDLDDKLAFARGVGGDVAAVGCEPFLELLVLACEQRVGPERVAEGQPFTPQAASRLG